MASTATGTTLLSPEFLRKLEQLAIAAKRVQLGSQKGERRSKRKGVSVEFADYRDYVQGDDLRHIDWNIYGRLDSLYLKLFQEQEDLTVNLLIDASKSMSFGSPPKIDFAVKLAAAIGYIGLVGYDRVSVEAFTDEGGGRMSPVRGKANARKLFGFLESVRAGGATALEEACRSYFIRNRSKGVAILVSDFFDEDGFEEPLRRLTQSGSDLYAVHVMAREEIDPELTGDLKLVDSETEGFAEITVSRTLLKRYKDNVNGFCDSIRRFCLARDINYIFAPSDTAFERVTLDVLRRGGLFR
jgi:uncharacterized protein (DUF58 family)